MCELCDDDHVRLTDGGVVPTYVLAGRAMAMIDNLVEQLMRSTTDRQRFLLCVAVSGAEQTAYGLLTMNGVEGCKYRTPAEVSISYFGHLVSAL